MVLELVKSRAYKKQFAEVNSGPKTLNASQLHTAHRTLNIEHCTVYCALKSQVPRETLDENTP